MHGCFLLLQALAAMVKLELPHINLLTKMDLCEDKQLVGELVIPDSKLLLDRCAAETCKPSNSRVQ